MGSEMCIRDRYLCIIIVDVSLIITYQAMSGSMIADLVEEAEQRTERRNEGIFSASVTFVRKITQGLGAAFAELILTISKFSAGATPGEVPIEVLRDFALVYAPTRLTVWMLMVFCLSMYTIERT